jgi:GH25 family lysozyme M1 (1,4-beta-N-acetylmuramidase)
VSILTPMVSYARRTLSTRTARLVATCALALPALVAGTATTAAATQAKAPADHYAGEFMPGSVHGPATLAPHSVSAINSGIDVSHYQGTINWTSVHNAGIQFAYIKATEGTGTIDAQFGANYTNAYYAGVIRGAYHFAHPDLSSGATQANFLLAHGGKWSGDGKTLPAMLDLEGGCYGKTAAGMVSWISDFVNTYKAGAGRYPSIYTTTSWWNTCTGNSGAFNTKDALFIARWSSTVGTLPNWPTWTFWQYTDAGSVSGISGAVDRDQFNGTYARLQAYATCTEENPC